MGLYIFFGILLLLVFLLSARLYAAVSYEEDVAVSVKYLFFRFKIFPGKSKKPKKRKKKGAVEETPPDKESQKKKPHVKLSQVSDFISMVAGAAKRLFRHVRIGRLMLDIEIGGEDAARTAIEYGAVSAVLFPLCGVVLANFNVNRDKFFVNLNARYDLKKTEVALSTEIGARPAVIIAIAVSVIFKYIISIIGNNKNRKKEILKGGAAK